MITSSFKRRTASRQAVSRKVEGIELRNCRDGKDDTVIKVEVNTDITAKARGWLLPRSLRPWHV